MVRIHCEKEIGTSFNFKTEKGATDLDKTLTLKLNIKIITHR